MIGPGSARRWIALLAALLVTSLGIATSAEARPTYRFCGPLPPGDGAFSYTNTRGVKCRTGIKVSRKVARRFCARPGNCEYGPSSPSTRRYQGRVGFRGWRCRVKIGYELVVVDCHKDSRRIFHKSAA